MFNGKTALATTAGRDQVDAAIIIGLLLAALACDLAEQTSSNTWAAGCSENHRKTIGKP